MGKGTLGGKNVTSGESGAATGRIGEVGLTGAPPEHERIRADQQPDEATGSRALEPVSPWPQQQEERPVQYTLRMSYDESDNLDTVGRPRMRRAGSAAWRPYGAQRGDAEL